MLLEAVLVVEISRSFEASITKKKEKMRIENLWRKSKEKKEILRKQKGLPKNRKTLTSWNWTVKIHFVNHPTSRAVRLHEGWFILIIQIQRVVYHT